MKILICSDTYKYQTNGVVTVLSTLVSGLRQLGHEVRVLAPSYNGKSFKNGDDCFLCSVPALYYPKERICIKHKDPLIDELISWNPDIINSHTEGMIGRIAIRIAKETKTPLVMNNHTDFAKYIFGRFYDIPPVRAGGKVFGKINYPHADAIIVPSEKSRGLVWMQPYNDIVSVIPSGIRTEKFQRPVSAEEKAELMRKYNIEDNGLTVVTVTRVSKEKNLMEILQYFASLLKVVPEAQLVIVGDGPDKKRLEKYCEQSGISDRVHFTGGVEPDEVYRYYALGDVFVCASTFEVQGMTYYEAMACGLPQVCRKDDCLINVIENGENGFIYENEQEFTDAVSKILLDKELREKMSRKALEKIKMFNDKRFVERVVELYEDVLKQAQEEESSPA